MCHGSAGSVSDCRTRVASGREGRTKKAFRGINMKSAWSSEGSFTRTKKSCVLSYLRSLVASHEGHLKSDHFSQSKKSTDQPINQSYQHQQRGSCKSILQMPIYELRGRSVSRMPAASAAAGTREGAGCSGDDRRHDRSVGCTTYPGGSPPAE